MSAAWAWVVFGAAAAGALLVYHGWRRRPTPEQRERLRRLRVDAEGRLTAGTLIEVQGALVRYRYEVGGVEYTACQDLGPVRHRLPADLTGLSGHVTVKYLPENPANSIVASEDWCGLHRRDPAGRTPAINPPLDPSSPGEATSRP